MTEEPWIETKSGGLFFVNALLVFPHVMWIVPLLTRIALRSAGRVPLPSEMLDTFPAVAEYLLPRYGILLLVPIALVIKNWRMETDPSARAVLAALLVLHAAALTWGIASLAGVVGELPGGP